RIWSLLLSRPVNDIVTKGQRPAPPCQATGGASRSTGKATIDGPAFAVMAAIDHGPVAAGDSAIISLEPALGIVRICQPPAALLPTTLSRPSPCISASAS